MVNEFVYKIWYANECQCLFPTTSFQSMWKVSGVGVLGHLNVASLNKQTKIGKRNKNEVLWHLNVASQKKKTKIEKKSKSERGKKSGLYLWLASSW